MLWDWSIVVFACNEQARIADSITAIANAVGGVRAHLTLIVNGSSDATLNTSLDTLNTLGIPKNVYTIALACKWNAMNAFVHEIRPQARTYFFVDATAAVEPQTFALLNCALDERREIAAVSGLPRNGRSAKHMQDKGDGLGQVFAVRHELLSDLVKRGRRLPVGLYRGDGLLIGYINYETNGVAHRSPQQRIATIFSARWYIRPLSPFNLHDYKRWYNRLVRQAQGRLENQAWNTIIWTKGFDALPRFGNEMILIWLKTHRPSKEPFPNWIFVWLALRRVHRWHQPMDVDLLPIKVL